MLEATASLGSSKVVRMEGVLEAAKVISVHVTTFAEAGVKHLKSMSEKRRRMLHLLYKNDDR